MEQTELATLRDLSRRLRVSCAWLKFEADSGRIPHIKAGHQRLFNVEAVMRLLADRAARDGLQGP